MLYLSRVHTHWNSYIYHFKVSRTNQPVVVRLQHERQPGWHVISPPRPSSGEFNGGLGIPGPRGRKRLCPGREQVPVQPARRPCPALPQICRAGLGWAGLVCVRGVCWIFFQAMGGVENAPRAIVSCSRPPSVCLQHPLSPPPRAFQGG